MEVRVSIGLRSCALRHKGTRRRSGESPSPSDVGSPWTWLGHKGRKELLRAWWMLKVSEGSGVLRPTRVDAWPESRVERTL